ncbi:ankyrin repeat-containing domain protein, partial [Tuber indicum]
RTLMLVGIDQNALDVRDQTPLRLAAASGKVATVRALLEDPTADVELCYPGGLKPLHAAAFAGHVEVVRVLLSDPRVDVNSRARQYDTTALHEAVYGSRAEVVRVLLASEGIDPN